MQKDTTHDATHSPFHQAARNMAKNKMQVISKRKTKQLSDFRGLPPVSHPEELSAALGLAAGGILPAPSPRAACQEPQSPWVGFLNISVSGAKRGRDYVEPLLLSVQWQESGGSDTRIWSR